MGRSTHGQRALFFRLYDLNGILLIRGVGAWHTWAVGREGYLGGRVGGNLEACTRAGEAGRGVLILDTALDE